MSEFTKEKWEVVDGTKVGEQVLFVHAPEIKGVVCRLTHTANPSIPLSKADFANAHLIAAAPEMYAMLKEVLSEMWMLIDEVNDQRLSHMRFDAETPPDLCDQETLHRIQVLLAKARGE